MRARETLGGRRQDKQWRTDRNEDAERRRIPGTGMGMSEEKAEVVTTEAWMETGKSRCRKKEEK